MCRSLGRPVDFDEDETRRIVGLLDDVESRHAGLLDAVAGILDSGLFESFDELRLDMYLNVDDLHNTNRLEPVSHTNTTMKCMVRVQFVLDSWKTIRKDVAGAVREFPAEAFDEKPIEGVDSFKTIARHVLGAGHAFPGILLAGVENLQTPDFREKMKPYGYSLPEDATPEQLAEALEKSLDERTAQLAAQPAGFFEKEITRFDGARLTRLEMLQFVKEHELTHRSQLFMLMRLKGMVPPTTRRRMAAAKS